MYPTVVKTCLKMFDCTTDIEPKLMLDTNESCEKILGFDAGPYAGISIFFLVIWVILPFLVLAIQLCRHQRHLETKMKDSASFRILYGWAISKYRYADQDLHFCKRWYDIAVTQPTKALTAVYNKYPGEIEGSNCKDLEGLCIMLLNILIFVFVGLLPCILIMIGTIFYVTFVTITFPILAPFIKLTFMWEVINAITKVLMAIGSETMLEENRKYLHVGTITVSLFIHIVARPYKDKMGNYMVIFFSVVNLFGILSKGSALLQSIFIFAILGALIVLILVVLKFLPKMLTQKKILELKDKNKKYGSLERKLLFPFLLLVVWPIKKITLWFIVKFKVEEKIVRMESKRSQNDNKAAQKQVDDAETAKSTETKVTEAATSKTTEETNELKNWGTKQKKAAKAMTIEEQDEMKNWGSNESKQLTSKTKVMPVSIASDEEKEETEEDASTTKAEGDLFKNVGDSTPTTTIPKETML